MANILGILLLGLYNTLMSSLCAHREMTKSGPTMMFDLYRTLSLGQAFSIMACIFVYSHQDMDKMVPYWGTSMLIAANQLTWGFFLSLRAVALNGHGARDSILAFFNASMKIIFGRG